MKYSIYKLGFTTGVHFGTGGLAKTDKILHADTVFSALCIEALKMGSEVLNKLVCEVKEDHLRLSDGLPFIGDRYYIPKPMLRLQIRQESNSSLKKAIKKMEYIPLDQLEKYLAGTMDIEKELQYFQKLFGREQLVEKASIHGLEETMPYAVDTWKYGKDSGLYLVIAFDNQETSDLLEALLDAVGFGGIGGKISSGYGKYTLLSGKLPQEFQKRLDGNFSEWMTLSLTLPEDAELENALYGSDYRVQKRSGFVASSTYADSFRKKKEVFMLQSGSTFKNRFRGQLLDVSDGGNHPVYRYAKPLFMGVL